MLSRPPSSPAIAILKPEPSSPSRLPTGTRTSSNVTARVGWAFQPILRSLAPNEMPGVSPGTIKAEMPRRPVAAGSRHHDVKVARAGAGDELLLSVEHVTLAVAHRARRQRRGIRTGAGFGQAVAREQIHRAKLAAASAGAVHPSRRHRSATPSCCGST